MRRPETEYTKTEGGYVAYQVFGSGPLDIVFITSWATNIDAMWEEQSLARYMERLASFGRVVTFDKRGSGVSDPVPLTQLPSLENWLDDARAVMEAAGSERAALIGDTEGGPMAMLFAATYPERVSALVLVNTYARMIRDEGYPIGLPEANVPGVLDWYESAWGRPEFLLQSALAPSASADERFRNWYARYMRLSMALGQSTTTYGQGAMRFDVRAVLPTIGVPTLVVQRADARWHRAAFGRYLAEHIPGAKYVEIPGADTSPFHAGHFDHVLDEVEEFLTGARPRAVIDRVLSTVMFTDIVGSTDRAALEGDSRWLALRDQHDRVVRGSLERYRGREIKTTGDGFLATFDGPARAVSSAEEITQQVGTLGIDVRVGLHTGEVELLGDDVGGIGVHIAQRIMAAAQPGGVLVSRTVKDLVVGSGIEFADRGEHQLKGVPGDWPLYQVVSVP
ncbi:MAG TPA: adenylate/guanylate cyclase domain-containing protein [Actinomycetota bacterium]|nr:adenylate/guanylate cyclase domain-containing protein [Actinomycetota bacterium]